MPLRSSGQKQKTTQSKPKRGLLQQPNPSRSPRAQQLSIRERIRRANIPPYAKRALMETLDSLPESLGFTEERAEAWVERALQIQESGAQEGKEIERAIDAVFGKGPKIVI